jgi:acetoin utilization deacetylase AcuC-like enzyme
VRTAFISHPYCERHRGADGHPECPARISAIKDHLISVGLYDFLRQYDAPKASMAALTRVHDAEYVRQILSMSPKEGIVHVDPDTYMNPYTVPAALRAAGAVVLAADLVNAEEVDNAFCCVRPPGHHAERAEAMGFCFFNNVAVGAAHALRHCGKQRVAIVDFDVHHGNGTEDIFENEPRVMVCSAYQHPFYPYSGRDSVAGRLVNVGLKAGTMGPEFRDAIENHWLPELEAFRPEMIFVSAGFDAHFEDEMAEFGLIETDYAWITERIMEVANRHAEGRIVSVLEGGYALHALARSASIHVRTLMGL